MRLLRRSLRELWSLFVDDGTSAALVVGWIVVGCLVLRALPSMVWSGPILFAGLALIVAFNNNSSHR